MKQVDIVRPSSINAINGPIGTLKRIIKNRNYFISRGYDVSLFVNESCQQGPFTELQNFVSDRTTCKTSLLRQKVSSWLRARAHRDLWAARIIVEKSRRQSERLIDYYLSLNRTPDVIQFHSDEECYFYLSKHKGPLPKIVLFLHSDGIPFKMELESLPGLKDTNYLLELRAQSDWTLKRADRLVFIAKIGQTNFLNFYPERILDSTSVIINGIDKLTQEQILEVDAIKNKEYSIKYRLCCTGTISYRKGQRTIIEAVSKLPQELRCQISVNFIGDGAERPKLENLCAELGVAEQINFLGNVPNQDVYKSLAASNIYVLMSKNEGLPISIIEAMRIGLPVISTRISGIPELVEEGYNGFLLNPDVEELAALLLKLPNYDWEQMGRNSYKRFENEFTFERMEKEFCDMYDKTLNQNKR